MAPSLRFLREKLSALRVFAVKKNTKAQRVQRMQEEYLKPNTCPKNFCNDGRLEASLSIIQKSHILVVFL